MEQFLFQLIFIRPRSLGVLGATLKISPSRYVHLLIFLKFPRRTAQSKVNACEFSTSRFCSTLNEQREKIEEENYFFLVKFV
jgi:hypothetical protein